MKSLNTRKIIIPINELISSICSTFIPAILNVIVICLIMKENENNNSYYSFLKPVASSIITIFSIIILHNILPKIKFFRPFKKYEGRWLQIIPELTQRPISIIDFNYDSKIRNYKMKGFNFTKDFKNGVGFSAHKFIERDYHDGFYYITNHTAEHKNGLGKIGFLETNYDGLIRAEGYFFDSAGGEVCSRKYHTIMIKCDKNFLKEIYPNYENAVCIEKIPPREIAEISQVFVQKEIESYNERVNNNYKYKRYCGCNRGKIC